MSEPQSVYSWHIRPVGENELSEILDVYRQCEDFLALGPQPSASMEMVFADLRLSREENGIFCGIFLRDETEPGKMIGVMDYVPQGFEGDAHRAYLSLLMIAAPYRSHRIGSQVVHSVEEIIQQNPDIGTIYCGVQANNPAAQRFWDRQGYSIESGPELLPDGTVAYRLRKDLVR